MQSEPPLPRPFRLAAVRGDGSWSPASSPLQAPRSIHHGSLVAVLSGLCFGLAAGFHVRTDGDVQGTLLQLKLTNELSGFGLSERELFCMCGRWR